MTMNTAEVQILKAMESDTEWINKHQDELTKKYSERFIAVKNGKVMAADKDFENLLKELGKKGISPAEAMIRFIFKKGYLFIL
jgi:ABC-type phosphate/phosphonate transport system ATPase subunit